MSKFIVSILVCCMFLSLTSCDRAKEYFGSSDEESKKTSEEENTSSSQEPTTSEHQANKTTPSSEVSDSKNAEELAKLKEELRALKESKQSAENQKLQQKIAELEKAVQNRESSSEAFKRIIAPLSQNYFLMGLFAVALFILMCQYRILKDGGYEALAVAAIIVICITAIPLVAAAIYSGTSGAFVTLGGAAGSVLFAARSKHSPAKA